MAQLAHELVEEAAARLPTATALRHGADRLSYAALAAAVAGFGAALRACGCGPDERVAVRLPASIEAVTALFGAGAAGCAFVLVDPAMAPPQCAALLRDCGARILVTASSDQADSARFEQIVRGCPSLRTVVVLGGADVEHTVPATPAAGALRVLSWDAFAGLSAAPAALPGSSSLAARS
ncbi:AMP-binding protein [Massilia sp. Dwa41.01b]|uniref:AMP-binding protein n=1 Tax=Massilia sp. Dwa41.01b TaxID=2709302 RepID=UPI00160038C2|nr:AMP-binding protein [Massilia sp. Dwa41.01b]QNA89068.1 AMP-binding protein [Massilia sp. Dwa41.01b]